MQPGHLTHLAAREHFEGLRREAARVSTGRAARSAARSHREPAIARSCALRFRLAVPAALVVAVSCGALATAALADPTGATGVRTYERVCDNGQSYTTYKVGHGAAFIAGSDEKFVNLNGGNAAAVQDDLVTCDFVQTDGPTKGSTGGTLTSKIVP